jgi:serine/threonine protein kinase/Tfp pilus assembly protein PilF
MNEASLSEKVSVESLVARAADEFLERQKNGEKPDIEEYAARYPQAADLLRKVLAALELIGFSQFSGSGLSADAAEPVGTLGDFRILREVGRGGMGIVYEAEQISLGRRVALKVLPFAATLDARHLQRFHNEARAAASLDHPAIVQVHAVGCERGVHFYAMQFIDGQSLDAFLRRLRQEAAASRIDDPERTTDELNPPAPDKTFVEMQTKATMQPVPPGPASFRRVAEWGIAAAGALEHAHGMGIVHRDIKPANLLIDGQGQLWITDFGLARAASDPGLTLTGDVLGTLRYMSPEQALAKHSLVDYRTDVYSLGVTLYELLTLHPAIDGEDREEMLRKIALEEPVPPRQRSRSIPGDLETIVLKAMEKNPADRYLSAQELADDLRRFLEDKPIQARRPTWAQRLRKWERRHNTAVIATGVATLLILLVIVGLLAVTDMQIRAEQRRTEEERDRTKAALTAEGEQRRLAEANLGLSLQALDEIFISPADVEVGQAQRQRRSLMTARQERIDRVHLQQGLEFYEKFAQTNRASNRLQGETGRAYQRAGSIQVTLGQQDKAEVAFRKAITILEKAEEKSPLEPAFRRELVYAYHDLSQLLMASGRAREAEEILRRDVVISEKLVTDFPAVPHDRLHLCHACCSLADLLKRTGRRQEAEDYSRQALEVARSIMADFPALDDASNYRLFSSLGELLTGQGRLAEAELPHRENLELARRLVARSPTVADHWQKMTLSQTCLVRLYIRADQLDKAEQVYRQSIALGKRLTTRFPAVAAYPEGPAWSHVGLGDLLWVRGQYAAAAEEYQRSVAVKPDYADGHWKLAWFRANCSEMKYRDPTRAVEEARKALALVMDNGHYWKTLGWACYRAGKWEVAIQDLEIANRLCAGGGSYEWIALAMAHWQRGDKELARQWYAKACQWMEDHKDPFAKEPGFFWEEEFRRIRTEAAELLQITERKTQREGTKDAKKPK